MLAPCNRGLMAYPSGWVGPPTSDREGHGAYCQTWLTLPLTRSRLGAAQFTLAVIVGIFGSVVSPCSHRWTLSRLERKPKPPAMPKWKS
jgi:hypothetical protein